MLSNKRNILQLVALMIEHGVEDVVVCPGSRNAPILHTLQEVAKESGTDRAPLRLHPLTDERSAGFFAIGQALATKKPVAVVVTSGSALVNLHPAVTEAFYQQVPLIVVSADRPQAWIGQMDGQTMPQAGAFGAMSKMSVCLPEVKNEEDAWHCNRLINEALMECRHRVDGPVHINVPISEPLYEFDTPTLPKERVIRRIEGVYPEQMRELAEMLKSSKRRMIIIGQKTDDRQIGTGFMKELDRAYIAVGEHLANPGEGSVVLLLNNQLMDILEANEEELKPDLVITVCGHIVNKRLKQFLRKHPPQQHWHVSGDGKVADLFKCLTTVVEAQPYIFLQALAYLSIPLDEGEDYSSRWKKKLVESEPNIPNKTEEEEEKEMERGQNGEYGGQQNKEVDREDNEGRGREETIVGRLMGMLPDDAVLHLANSSSVRYAQEFKLKASVTVCCNRGINGIEGCMSSAVGYAKATPERPNYVVIGDLAFFYDQNALWNTELPDNLHILVLNNGGGKIFDTLPLPESKESRRLIQAKHHTSAESVAQEYGLRYMRVENTISELEDAFSDFILSKTSTILEIVI